jgi:hypothetical protein
VHLPSGYLYIKQITRSVKTFRTICSLGISSRLHLARNIRDDVDRTRKDSRLSRQEARRSLADPAGSAPRDHSGRPDGQNVGQDRHETQSHDVCRDPGQIRRYRIRTARLPHARSAVFIGAEKRKGKVGGSVTRRLLAKDLAIVAAR